MTFRDVTLTAMERTVLLGVHAAAPVGGLSESTFCDRYSYGGGVVQASGAFRSLQDLGWIYRTDDSGLTDWPTYLPTPRGKQVAMDLVGAPATGPAPQPSVPGEWCGIDCASGPDRTVLTWSSQDPQGIRVLRSMVVERIDLEAWAADGQVVLSVIKR